MKAVSKIALLGVLQAALAGAALAETKFPARGRLFFGASFIKPDDVNAVQSAEGLDPHKALIHYGVEITTPVYKILDLGFRYQRHMGRANELGSSGPTTNYSEFDQHAVQAVARVGLLRTNVFKFDLFGGVGGANTTFTISTAGQSGELKKVAASKEWLGALVGSYGASASVGYKNVFLTLEGGMEINKASDLTRSGTVSATIEKLNLSGPYILIGLMFDGITATK
jgi:hypothetical protein